MMESINQRIIHIIILFILEYTPGRNATSPWKNPAGPQFRNGESSSNHPGIFRCKKKIFVSGMKRRCKFGERKPLLVLRFSTTTFDTSSTKHPSTDSCSEASTTWFGSLPEVAELELETWPIGNDLRKNWLIHRVAPWFAIGMTWVTGSYDMGHW